MSDTTELLPHIKLRFNIEHPSFEECYMYGHECAMAGISEDSNPYLPESKASEQWFEGWWAGFYEHEPALYEESHDAESMDPLAENDAVYHEGFDNFFLKLLEISGVIAVSAIVGYQLIELVA